MTLPQRVDKTSGAGAPKAPLCKGSCHANSVTEGLMRYNAAISPESYANALLSTAQSLRAAFRRPTSLYTREALVLCKLIKFYADYNVFDCLREGHCPPLPLPFALARFLVSANDPISIPSRG